MMLDRMEGNAELKTSVHQMLASRRLTHSVLLVGEEGLGAGFAARCVAADYLYPAGGAPAEALLRGECEAFKERGAALSGLDVYISSNVPKGSGVSSSAAFEVLIGVILNDRFMAEKVSPIAIAQIGQWAENVYFGKPCGLMDQMASSVGNIITIDFADPAHPDVEPLAVDFSKAGLALCILDSGAGHEDLTDEYSAITNELRAVCRVFGKEVLREVPEEAFLAELPKVRAAAGDRAVNRAFHVYAENRRALAEKEALRQGDFDKFLALVRESGRSSAMYLQNVIPTGSTAAQELMVTIALCERILEGRGAVRVHGGGFGGTRANPNAPQRGESLRTSVTISFEEAAFGCEKEISIERVEQCDTCRGTGCEKGTTAEVCPDCRGTGMVQQRRQTPLGFMSTSAPCGRCGGKGRIIHQPCKACHGSGQLRRRKTLKVTIPAGIDNGQTISLRGQGNAGRNGGPAGDLLIVIAVRPHEIFRREGTSVLCEAPITFTQAVLGAELEIPTIDGKVKYSIPEGTQSGTTFRIRGKGIPYVRGNGRGDQFVTVNIRTPKNLTSSQKELLRQFAASMGDLDGESGKSIFGKKKR